MILEETITYLNENYAEYIESLSITDVRIGIFMTAVKLSDGSVGVSGTMAPQTSAVHCKKENRDFGAFTPNQITGKKVTELLEAQKKNSLTDTLKVATLNAISSKILEFSNYKIITHADPIDLIDLNTPQTITIVGAFQSYIRKISSTKNRLFVLEFDEKLLDEKHRKYFMPASRYSKILPVSDTVIITGQTLVNNTLDELLKSTKPEANVIVTGPTSSFIPDVLFAANVKIMGATRPTHPELMLKLAGEGGTGYHMFKYCAEKICILNE
jgi:uncharacterized protein (DUF4213/DUF364 family)